MEEVPSALDGHPAAHHCVIGSGFLRDWLRTHNQAGRRGHKFRALGRRLEGASQAQQTRALIVVSVIDALPRAPTVRLSLAAFRVCGLCPYEVPLPEQV